MSIKYYTTPTEESYLTAIDTFTQENYTWIDDTFVGKDVKADLDNYFENETETMLIVDDKRKTIEVGVLPKPITILNTFVA